MELYLIMLKYIYKSIRINEFKLLVNATPLDVWIIVTFEKLYDNPE